jgi:hypothetical protein
MLYLVSFSAEFSLLWVLFFFTVVFLLLVQPLLAGVWLAKAVLFCCYYFFLVACIQLSGVFVDLLCLGLIKLLFIQKKNYIHYKINLIINIHKQN